MFSIFILHLPQFGVKLEILWKSWDVMEICYYYILPYEKQENYFYFYILLSFGGKPVFYTLFSLHYRRRSYGPLLESDHNSFGHFDNPMYDPWILASELRPRKWPSAPNSLSLLREILWWLSVEICMSNEFRLDVCLAVSHKMWYFYGSLFRKPQVYQLQILLVYLTQTKPIKPDYISGQVRDESHGRESFNTNKWGSRGCCLRNVLNVMLKQLGEKCSDHLWE